MPAGAQRPGGHRPGQPGLLATGDEVLLPANVYGPSREMARHELARWGITHRLYDPMDAACAGRADRPGKTKLIWLEAPGSVTMEFPDLRGLVAVAKASGVLTALDNTWGAGIALRGFEHGVDIVMQALTKYPSGGGDVLMGSVTTRDAALHERIKLAHMHLGLGVGANDVELVLRSLASLPLRYAAQDQAGRELAAWMASRARGGAVLHPALQGSPGHAHWQACCSGGRRIVFRAAAAALQPAAGACFRRRAETVPHRLFMGRAHEPGRAL
jgi:cystathionine beta-lyase